MERWEIELRREALSLIYAGRPIPTGCGGPVGPIGPVGRAAALAADDVLDTIDTIRFECWYRRHMLRHGYNGDKRESILVKRLARQITRLRRAAGLVDALRLYAPELV